MIKQQVWGGEGITEIFLLQSSENCLSAAAKRRHQATTRHMGGLKLTVRRQASTCEHPDSATTSLDGLIFRTIAKAAVCPNLAATLEGAMGARRRVWF